LEAASFLGAPLFSQGLNTHLSMHRKTLHTEPAAIANVRQDKFHWSVPKFLKRKNASAFFLFTTLSRVVFSGTGNFVSSHVKYEEPSLLFFGEYRLTSAEGREDHTEGNVILWAHCCLVWLLVRY